MLVSLRWLSQYVDLPGLDAHSMDAGDDALGRLADRLSLSGLNHEATFAVDGDVVFDLEVTSNRGDCLGHIGVAREIAVLDETDLRIPAADVEANGPPIEDSLSVQNEFAEACPRYTARLIRGVKIGPSPDWMIDRLRSAMARVAADGSIETYKPINNVVDATNYVLLECGSPLHAFDYASLAERKIVIRRGGDDETIEAIDHRIYQVAGDVVIADGRRAQAIGGVMGGADSEVTETTTDVVIEAATFTPLNIRRTARRLKLHSPSSFRFERRVDRDGLDWASRRVCELILQTAGGTLAQGCIDTDATPRSRPSIRLPWDQLTRILGVAIPAERAESILKRLGCQSASVDAAAVTVVPPTYRHDLTRPADLIEEVARIHGYDAIPENVPVAVVPSSKRAIDTGVEVIRGVMTASGFSEAMTPSVVTAKLNAVVSPWSDDPPLSTATAMLKRSDTLRRSLIPSLLECRAKNWTAASIDANLFEIAHAYVPQIDRHDGDDLPTERKMLAMVSGGDYLTLKGVIETIYVRLGIIEALTLQSSPTEGLVPESAMRWRCGDSVLGTIGVITAAIASQFKLSSTTVAAELDLHVLLEHAHLVPQQQSVSSFPSIRRDLNFIVGPDVRWADLRRVAAEAIGETMAELQYRETYRNPDDGDDRRRLLMSVRLQRPDRTLTGDEAEQLVSKMIAEAKTQLAAELVA